MKLTTLVENTSCDKRCGAIHGLSLDIETPQHHILFDMGPNALFLENAEMLGVDVSAADVAFLSHGHYDHGGGLELFCKRNKNAIIFISPYAFGTYAVHRGGSYEAIGLETHVQQKYEDRFRNFAGWWDEELFLFDDVTGTAFLTAASASLLEKTQEGYQSDRFLHEQNLIISCEGKLVLFAGCAHRGIVNILRTAEKHMGRELDYVISGFHLTNPGLGIDEPIELIRAVGEELRKREKTRYITGHCTGEGPYHILKEMLGDRLDTMPAGRTFLL
jgi:7,8-dihydropterin-6-yl-methyl-4-(beta-D-ribofuranosyl)aminobenzene 5'-phosphate synthase